MATFPCQPPTELTCLIMAELEAEAALLAPLFERWRGLHLDRELSDVDLVGAFVLAYCALRRPRAWAGGRRGDQRHDEDGEARSVYVNELPGLLGLLDEKYLKSRLSLGSLDELSVLGIFQRVHLSGVKKNSDDFLRTSMLEWYRGNRPYELMFSIPSPIEVRRLITSFERYHRYTVLGATATSRREKSDHDAHQVRGLMWLPRRPAAVGNRWSSYLGHLWQVHGRRPLASERLLLVSAPRHEAYGEFCRPRHSPGAGEYLKLFESTYPY